ncbi:uncharacterized protein HMPREF1541_02861 [Cyphellophora europaea CBS 101466]|uniref:Glycolipid transfer protein domain-containing protein n=1 Tax=Cyphellophora europaea (strain CBS 101466) TaxID=1220924 RepID=W2S4T4_CYPE1|nr:uncharacterized protein HMPREF1541_02861 [Cyphellophora europaea CBS 101466]ETN43702.1 hypothetical protein HMPREF1541_02861 [Cyphellophora europaea CBS 101466]
MAAIIAPDKTWFGTLQKHFSDVPVDADQGIPTEDFLAAAASTTTLFDLLGSVAFTPVKNDMNGNVKKIRDRYNASPSNSGTLQSLCKNELASKSHTATEGLLWLIRGLDFTAQALRHDLTSNAGLLGTEPKPKAELADSFRSAYKGTLAPHHGFMVKPIFSAAMSATPYRKDFYSKLAGSQVSSEKLTSEVERWVSALEERIAILKTFLASKEAKW